MATMYGLDEKLAKLTPDQVVKSYSGKLGCACGCGGRYSYLNAEEGTKDRGYEVEPTEVSRRRITDVLATIQSNAAEATFYADISRGGLWEFETETRAYRVYVR
jgi:hypothetical protein